jgi:hypothetical protein
MQIATKMLGASILSLLVGIAFASPLFYSDAVMPLHPFPQGPTADIKLDFVYADFLVQPNNPDTRPSWMIQANQTAYNLTFYLVLSVTNNGDEPAVIHQLDFIAARNVSNTVITAHSGSFGGWVEGVWVDGVWYNVTRIQGTTVWPDQSSSNLSFKPSFFVPYLHEGVQIYETKSMTNSTFLMDMNGTWVDITGRTNFTGFDISSKNAILQEFSYVNRFFFPQNHISRGVNSNNIGIPEDLYTFTDPGLFSNIWAPHETRLILLNGTQMLFASGLETLNSGTIFLKAQAHSSLADSRINGTLMDTASRTDSIQQIQLQILGDNYSYNSILNENEMFQTDQFGAEVFVKPRS